MKELLLSYKFRKTSHCNCNGFYTETYKRDAYSIKVRTKKYVFKVSSDKFTSKNWQPFVELEPILKQLFPDNV